MGIINVPFEIPSWVEKGLNDGTLIRIGGLVRNVNGEIIYHLKEANKATAKSINPKKTVAALVIAGSAIAVTAIVYSRKFKKLKKLEEEINNLFETYINNVKQNNLNVNKIEQLEQKCDEILSLINEINSNNIKINQQDFEKINTIIDLIRNYIEQLNEANNTNKLIPTPINNASIKDNIIVFRKYLSIQKEIFKQKGS
ncbi:hypothetical protein CTH_10007 (plasmid) [Carboxydocella thermautotrophica]|nr:hypothetical protein CTH_10007 [Carboxydocella thermautotrophica]